MAISIDPKKATKEQMQRAFELLEKEEIRKERIKKGEIKGGQKWSELSDEQKEQRKAADRRRRAGLAILKQKAIDAGITVSEAEVDAYLAK